MRIAYLFLNGNLKGRKEFFVNFINSNKGDIYCADGGANHCHKLGFIPKEIWGDFDSIKKEVKEFFENKKVKFEKFKKEKDNTDAELILNEISTKYDKVYCIAGLGGEIEHELTNINLLTKYKNLIFLTSKKEIFKIENEYTFENHINKKISFIIFSDEIKKLNLNGFKYDVSDLNLIKGDTRCISNIIESNKAKISLETGSLICIKNC